MLGVRADFGTENDENDKTKSAMLSKWWTINKIWLRGGHTSHFGRR